MTARSIPLVIATAFAFVALGQTTADQSMEKVFHFTYTYTPQGIQEIVNMMRSITEVPQATADDTAKTLALRGTADQLALAGWLLPQVDRLAPPAPQSSQSTASTDYRLGGSSNAVARVFYIRNAATPRALQEILNAVRSIFEVQRAVAYNSLHALILRGTAEQIAASEWLINGLDKPSGVAPVQGGSRAVLAYSISDLEVNARLRSPAARIFYLTHTPTPQALQEIVNSVRSLTELQRVMPNDATRAIALRGTTDQVAMAEWLIQALDRPADTPQISQDPAASQFQSAAGDQMVRVFYLHPAPPQELQELVNQIRSITYNQRAVYCSAPGALAIRGTAGQVALAGKIIQERDKL